MLYMTTPYTYLIGWPELNLWYYGVRFAKNCDPSELLKTYFTSSIHVVAIIQQHGIPSVSQIRKIFTDITTAREWETRVLKRLGVTKRSDFINRTDNKSIAPQCGIDNPATRPEVKDKIRESIKEWYETHDNPNLGTTWTEEEKREWAEIRTGEGNPFYNKSHSKENIKLFSENQIGDKNSFYNKSHSDEQKEKWSRDRSGISKSRVCCILCKKEVAVHLFLRWHSKCV